MNQNYKPVVIGVGGLAMSGKDTFVKIAKRILKDNGYSCIKLAFADSLKEELDSFTKKYYNISAWTNDPNEKTLIRRSMVSHGCIMRDIDPKHWIDQIDKAIETIHFTTDVIFISDCRFENEVNWLHEKWGGWFVHVKKYSSKFIPKTGGTLTYVSDINKRVLVDHDDSIEERIFDQAPNEEEAVQDPLCEAKSDYKLELENVIEKTLRETGIKIKADSLVDNSYLLEQITLCLSKCPSLTILRP